MFSTRVLVAYKFIKDKNRSFKDTCGLDYFVINDKDKIHCVVCIQVIAVIMEYNVKKHYATSHEN